MPVLVQLVYPGWSRDFMFTEYGISSTGLWIILTMETFEVSILIFEKYINIGFYDFES